jgi:hypothetical protein
MSKTFHCPSCGAALENVDFTKPTTRCPYCGTVVTIPANLREQPSRSATPDYQQQVVINLGDYAQQPYGQTINRRRSNPAGCIFTMLILFIVFAVVGGGILVATNSLSSFSEVIESLNTPGAMATLTGGNIGAIISTAAPQNLEVLLQFGGDGVGNGTFKDGRWVAIDGSGGIYVADYNSNGRVQAFDKEGEYLATYIATARDKSIPTRCLAADRKGIVYVCRDGYIQKFNSLVTSLVRSKIRKVNTSIRWRSCPTVTSSSLPQARMMS